LQAASTFLNETCLSQLILLTYCFNFDILCNYYLTISLYNLQQFHKKPLRLFYTEEVKAFIKILDLIIGYQPWRVIEEFPGKG